MTAGWLSGLDLWGRLRSRRPAGRVSISRLERLRMDEDSERPHRVHRSRPPQVRVPPIEAAPDCPRPGRADGWSAVQPESATRSSLTPRLLEMLAYWRIYAERCAARYTISKQDRLQLRAQKLGLALVNNAYRDAVNGSISYRALARDVVVSLIARPGQSGYAESLLSTSSVRDDTP